MGLWGGRFRVASAIAFDSQGHVHIADFYNNRIQKFSLEGAYLGQWGDNENGKAALKGPTGIAVETEGNLYVVDFHNNRIVKIERR